MGHSFAPVLVPAGNDDLISLFKKNIFEAKDLPQHKTEGGLL